MTDLISKYRPATFADVIGQEAVVASLQKVVKDRSSRSFLFTGPSGTGKTTLARILANEFKCHPSNIVEVDAATFSGIDDMRGITEKLAFLAIRGTRIKVVIIDECHALSKAAWQSLLKPIEEPPAHVVWCLCTTEAEKVPETIRNRCARYDLKPVNLDDVYDLLVKVAKAEKFQVPEEVLSTIASKCQGSPRRALSGLAACSSCESRAEALDLLREVDTDDSDIINLCRLFLKGNPTWPQVAQVLKGISDKNPESVRIVFCAYWQKVALGSEGSKAERALEILSAFEKPYPQQSNHSSLILSLGRLIFQGG